MSDFWTNDPVVPAAKSAPKFWESDPVSKAGESEKPSTATDIAKSGGVGLAKGAIMGVGAGGDVRNLASAATDYLGNKFGASPESIQSFKDAAYNAAQHVPHATPILGAARVLSDAPSSGDIQKKVEEYTGEFYKPQTTAGKYAETTGEFLGNPTTYLGPGRILAKAATAVGGALGSEGAKQYADYVGMTPLGKTLAPLVGAIAGAHGVTTVPRITPIIPRGRQEMTQLLEREGVPLTAGDRTGGTMLKAAEDELSPGANEAQRHAFRQAAFNRVGEQIGDRSILGPNGAVNNMMNRVGAQFDAIANRNHVRADPQLVSDIQDIHQTYNDIPGLYPQETVNSVNGALDRVRSALNTGGGSLAGPDYQTLRSNLRGAAQNASDQQRAQGLHSVTNALDDAMERTIQQTNPADAGRWPQIRRDYRNALVLQNWAGAANMTPATLRQAAKTVYGKDAYVRGRDDFSDLAEAGHEVLKAYQDSGTARRLQIEGLMKMVGGLAGYGLGAHSGMSEGGVGGLLFGENAAPLFGRPLVRKALMSPLTQGALSNQFLPYRFETSPSTIALMNAIRGGQTPQAPSPPVSR
jgi:hypothetical protein